MILDNLLDPFLSETNVFNNITLIINVEKAPQDAHMKHNLKGCKVI